MDIRKASPTTPLKTPANRNESPLEEARALIALASVALDPESPGFIGRCSDAEAILAMCCAEAAHHARPELMIETCALASRYLGQSGAGEARRI